MSNLTEVIGWLATGGAVAAVAWFASWALEGFSAWNTLPSRVKSLVILALSLVIGLLATWVRLLPPEQLTRIMPYANTAILTIVAWLGTQVAHRADRSS